MPSHHTISKPRWRFEALQLPVDSSAAASKLTSSQLLSSTHEGAAKIVSFLTWVRKQPVRTPAAASTALKPVVNSMTFCRSLA